MKNTKVFITVDTEHSIGGAFSNSKLKPVGNKKRIFGHIEGKDYGIPLIMEIAHGFGLQLTFFLEVFNKYYFSEKETREVCEYILKNGHDVQLHIHPNYLNFTCDNPKNLAYSDFMSEYSFDRQKEILAEGRDLLQKYGAHLPVAFRAGSYAANPATLKALKKTGFLVDSSYNRAFCSTTCAIPASNINDLAIMEGIWEFPVTNFIENTGVRARRFMPLDINGVGFREMKQVLNHAASNGPQVVTIILHSFSFLKPFDVQYNRIKPRKIAMERFKKLCRFLAENMDRFQVMTFTGLNETTLAQWGGQSCNEFLKMPAAFSLIRGLEQLKDRIV